MVSVSWDAHEVIFIDYVEKGRTITGAYYTALLDRLVDEIRKKQPYVHCIIQTWPPATIICPKTSRNDCVLGVLSRTKEFNKKQ